MTASPSPYRSDFIETVDFGNGLGPVARWVEFEGGEPVVDHLIACQGAWRTSKMLRAVTEDAILRGLAFGTQP